LLGARVGGDGVRIANVTQTATVTTEGGGRQDATGTGRAAVRTDRPPGRPEQAREAPEAPRTTFDRLVRSIRINQGQRESTARLQLEPPELGRVRIDVRLVNQRMQLSIQTETRDAREVLGSRLEALRSALAAHGVVIEKIDLPDPPPETDPRAFVWQDHDMQQRDSQDVADAEEQAGDSGAMNELGHEEAAPPESADLEPVMAGASSDSNAGWKRVDIRI
jgi:flagellar hook-length control protein FliK